jgi:DNA-binding MarR family transcriptional regulator
MAASIAKPRDENVSFHPFAIAIGFAFGHTGREGCRDSAVQLGHTPKCMSGRAVPFASEGIMAEHNPRAFAPADVEKTVLHIILARRTRAGLFTPELFFDPAWDMLLVLFLARLRRQSVAMSHLAEETAVSASTAVRWLDALDRQGLVIRKSDLRGDRGAFVELSARGTAAMQEWVEQLIESQSGPRSDDRVIDLLTRIHEDRG